jgi:O-antigen ligase
MPATAPAASAAREVPEAARAARLTLWVLQAGGFACVLAAVSPPVFQLDRYTVPKELVLYATAALAGLLCLGAARRLSVFMVDWLLAAFLGVSLLSTIAATNGWLAFQALGVSISGAVLFWTARAVTRAGYGQALLVALAAAVVFAAVTALAQAYGLVTTPLFTLARAPGGTFGNRNFIAHLAAIGFPLLLLVTLEARGRSRFTAGTLGVALIAATLFLTRSRAGWLAAGLSGAFLAVEGLWLGRLWYDPARRSRIVVLGAAAAIGVAAAWALPNRLNWRSDSPYLESLAGMANYRDGSGRGRLIQYRNSLAMTAAHPWLGVGPGNWPVHYPRFMAPNDPSFDAGDFIPTNPWPSSDWIAMFSERGVAAGFLFALIGVALALAAWMRVRMGHQRNRGQAGELSVLHDLTIVATLVATGIVGAFDAVVLLPVPTFFIWTIVGALTSSAQPVREIPLTPVGRRRLLMAAGVVSLLFVVRAASRVVAIEVYGNGRSAAAAWAARIDPGNYRIHVLLANAELAKGRCATAVPHAKAAQELFPNYPTPRHLLRACGRDRLLRRNAAQ